MTEPDAVPPPARQLRDQREKTIGRLTRAFAEDQLDVDELEQRIDLAHRATSTDQLTRLVSDLPVPAAHGDAKAPASARAPARRAPPPSPTRRENETVFAVFAGIEKRGVWEPPARLYVVAAAGGAEIDFRDVALPAGVTEVTAIAVMGGVEIVVPPGVRVQLDGTAFMGGFAYADSRAIPATDPDAPVVRVTGFACMGAVEVDYRHPGETAKDARRRRRRAQRGK